MDISALSCIICLDEIYIVWNLLYPQHTFTQFSCKGHHNSTVLTGSSKSKYDWVCSAVSVQCRLCIPPW